MKQFLTESEFTQQVQTKDFVLKVQQQIAKDFAASGLIINTSFVSEEWNHDQIVEYTAELLHEVIKFGESALLQLMYQIDIPQDQFLSLIGNEEFTVELSRKILLREAYKVFLRSKF